MTRKKDLEFKWEVWMNDMNFKVFFNIIECFVFGFYAHSLAYFNPLFTSFRLYLVKFKKNWAQSLN